MSLQSLSSGGLVHSSCTQETVTFVVPDLDSLHQAGLHPHGLPPTATLGGPKPGGNKEVLLLNSAVTTSLAGGACFHEMQRELGFVGYY